MPLVGGTPTAWADALRERDALEAEGHLPDADADYLTYQIQELNALDFDDEGLRDLPSGWRPCPMPAKSKPASTRRTQVLSSDGGALDRLHDAERALEGAAGVHPESQALLDRLRSVRIELDDLAREAEGQAEGIDLDPEALARAEADRDRHQRLFDKHRASTLEELANALAAMEERLDAARNRDRKLAECNAQIDSGAAALDAIGTRLNAPGTRPPHHV